MQWEIGVLGCGRWLTYCNCRAISAATSGQDNIQSLNKSSTATWLAEYDHKVIQLHINNWDLKNKSHCQSPIRQTEIRFKIRLRSGKKILLKCQSKNNPVCKSLQLLMRYSLSEDSRGKFANKLSFNLTIISMIGKVFKLDYLGTGCLNH